MNNIERNDVQDAIEVRRLRRLLQEVTEISQHASMTGSLSGGAASGIRRYNATVRQLEAFGAISPGMFEPLPEGTSFDELGVESKLLAGTLEEFEEPQPPPPPSPPNGPHNNVIIGLGGLKELNELRDLGKLIRDHFPAWIRGQGHPPQERGEAAQGEQAKPQEPGNSVSLSQVESRLVEIGVKLQAIAEQIRRSDLNDAQRIDLADQLSRLGQEQANLARQNAQLREKY